MTEERQRKQREARAIQSPQENTPASTSSDAVSVESPPSNSPQHVTLSYVASVFPPPDFLQSYNDIMPNGAQMVFEIITSEQKQRHYLQRAASLRQDRGQWFGLIVALIFLGGAVYLIATGHDISGTLLGVGDLASLVGIFVYGSRERRRMSQVPERNEASESSDS